MQSDAQAPAGDRPAAMPFIMLTVLLDMVSLGLIIPVLPALVGSFTHSQAEQVFWYGALMFSFACSNFIASPILGRLSDSYGRRPVLLIGFCGLALNFFATALASALWMLLLVRLIGGMMQANMAVANAYVADITPAAQRARRFGMLGAMFGLGFIVGPMLGGLLGAINLRLPFFLAGTLALLNLLYGYFVLPESLPPQTRRPFHWSAANPLTALRELGQMGTLRPLMLVIACGSLAQFVMFSTWVLYCSLKFGWGPTQNGWSLATSGLVSVLVQGVLLGRLLRCFSPRRLAVAGMLSASLDDVCDYCLQSAGHHGNGLRTKHYFRCGGCEKPGAGHGGHQLDQQSGSRTGAPDWRTLARAGLAFTTWRLAYRCAAVFLWRPATARPATGNLPFSSAAQRKCPSLMGAWA